ncbi:MAG: hypothetical protein ACOVP4_01355 [Bacteriovoracaceae bacterium]
MKDKKSKEALFNEIKGSLFEYLFARELARLSQTESSFLKSISDQYQIVLSQQDRMVREFYPDLIPFLGQMSKKTVEYFLSQFQEPLDSVKLLGKFVNTEMSGEIKEADVIIESNQRQIPISLKLTKESSYVNTKSGGIKSFIKTYFQFDRDQEIQHEFNLFVDQIFAEMGHSLHTEAGLEYDGTFKDWIRRGYSELPGELEGHFRVHIHDFYNKVKTRLYDILLDLYKKQPEAFLKALPALCGFSNENMGQLTCYHDFSDKGFSDPRIHFEFFKQEIFSQIIKLDLHPGLSYFDIELEDRILQIRVKSMNKFTSTAMKINCSVKFKRLSFPQ